MLTYETNSLNKHTHTQTMESTEESKEEYTEADGTRVIKHTIIKRIKPSTSQTSARGRIESSNSNLSQLASRLDIADPKTLNQFEVIFLNKHNEYRAKHGVPQLKLSREVLF